MQDFKKIMFTTDFSDASAKLIPYVRMMAEKFDAEVHVVYVSKAFEHFTDIYVPHPSIDKFEKEIVEGAEKRLKEFMEEYGESLPNSKSTLLVGDITEKIPAYIQENGIDLMLLGPHARKGLDRFIFGSVAQKLMETTQIPVMLFNPYKNE
jgi:nucleotide-binding universal stress UspA family protein